MKNSTTLAENFKFVGLDVHKDTIAVAVAESGIDSPRTLGTIPNSCDALKALLLKFGRTGRLRVCYEAGPCGYVIHRFLQSLGIECAIVAPSLIPRKPGERIKTDRRDALMLARLLRSGELTPTWVPDPQTEALRDLIRAREDAVEDRLRERNRLSKFLLRLGIKPPPGINAWSCRHRQWLDALSFAPPHDIVFREYRQTIEETTARIARLEREVQALSQTISHAPMISALQALRGVKLISAATVISELGDITRFRSPRELMAYAGLIPGEHSSGNRIRRGGITKTGNAHVRRVIIEAAWHYRHRPVLSRDLRRRQRAAPPAASRIAWNAQERLFKRYHHLVARGKPSTKAVIAVGRELLGFLWAIAVACQSETPITAKAA